MITPYAHKADEYGGPVSDIEAASKNMDWRRHMLSSSGTLEIASEKSNQVNHYVRQCNRENGLEASALGYACIEALRRVSSRCRASPGLSKSLLDTSHGISPW
jgi:hypothetical protein